MTITDELKLFKKFYDQSIISETYALRYFLGKDPGFLPPETLEDNFFKDDI